jgi:chorismate synthase
MACRAADGFTDGGSDGDEVVVVEVGAPLTAGIEAADMRRGGTALEDSTWPAHADTTVTMAAAVVAPTVRRSQTARRAAARLRAGALARSPDDMR